MKTTYTLKILCFIISFTSGTIGYSQAITKVKTELIETSYGNAKLLVTPSVYDANAAKPTATSGVYAIIVCFTVNNVSKAIHQDLTYDFHKKGNKELYLSATAKKSNTVINDVYFYRRDQTPKDQIPTKGYCN